MPTIIILRDESTNKRFMVLETLKITSNGKAVPTATNSNRIDSPIKIKVETITSK